MTHILIFSEGKGSVLYLLKEKGLATFLSAGIGQEGTQRSSLAYVLNTAIHLTDEGLEKVHLTIYIYFMSNRSILTMLDMNSQMNTSNQIKCSPIIKIDYLSKHTAGERLDLLTFVITCRCMMS
jgi:secreted Zn-dependent insulinase-like peptidase